MRRILVSIVCIGAACGGSSTPSIDNHDGGAGSDSGASREGGTTSSGGPSGDDGGDDSARRLDGGQNAGDARNDDASPNTPDAGGGTCACDASTEYCLHGDLTVGGSRDVYRCEPQIGDCPSCSCYMQVGVCLEEAVPKACAVVSDVIVVKGAEIP